MRVAQVDKRAHKLVGMRQEVAPPTLYGPKEAATTYVCWGSTYGPLREAVDRMNAHESKSANMLHLKLVWPLRVEVVEEALAQANRLVAVEVNATAQLATLIRAHTGREVDDKILRYDGRPLTPEYILKQAGRE